VDQDMNVDQLIKEENLDTQNMTPPLEIDKLELIFVVHGYGVEHSSLSSTKIFQEYLIEVTTINHSIDYLPKTILEPSCSKNSCDFILSLSINNEHEYVLDNFLCSYFLVEQDMNVD
jgi:hypothetical protein